MNNITKYITAMIFFGTISIFIKNIALSSGEISFWRAVIAFVVLNIYILVRKQHFDFSTIKKQLLKLFLSGAAMGLNWIFLFEAYNYTTVAVATLCYYFAPVLVIILSTFLFHESLRTKQILCFICASTGLILMIGSMTPISGSFKGILLGLLAAVFYAIVVLINKSIKDVDGLIRTILQFLAAIITLFPYILLTGGFKITFDDTMSLINLLIIGVIHTGIMYVLYFTSLSYLRGSQIAILGYLDPLTAVLISIVLLKEPFTWLQLFGGFIILFATLLSERYKD